MPKYVFTSISVAVLSLLLATACAEEGADAEATSGKQATEPGRTEPVAESAAPALAGTTQKSIMDQPVDFSSPGNVEKTLEAIRQQAGEKEANSIKNAIGYMVVYDLSVNRDKNKLYQKLDGKTPTEILGMIRR